MCGKSNLERNSNVARSCCVCGKKIGFMDSYMPLECDKPGYILCENCFSKLSGNIDAKEAEQYFESFFQSQSIDLEIVDAIKKEIDKAQKIYERKMQDDQIQFEQNEKNQEALLERKKEFQSRWDDFNTHNLITTGLSFEGYQIVSYHGLVSGDVVLGTGFLSEFSAGISDILGSTSKKFSSKMVEAKKAAQKILIDEALKAGGNAVIGVDFDYILFGNNMIGVSANGTSVKVVKS